MGAKADTKRMNHENLMQKIHEDSNRKEEFHQNKIYKKAATYETYEKLCHI